MVLVFLNRLRRIYLNLANMQMWKKVLSCLEVPSGTLI